MRQYSMSHTLQLDCLVIVFLFVLSPFWGAIFALICLTNAKKEYHINFFLFVISLFWGVLAYTQKSISKGIDTDIVRYYEMLSAFDITSFSDLVQIFVLSGYAFVFTPISCLISFIMGNLQYMCLFWVTLSYYLFFITLKLILRNEGLLTAKRLVSFLIISMLCLMLFVQISETIKNASAFAIFFYILVQYYYKGFSWKLFGGLVLAVGVHPSVLMLLPLFLYKRFNTHILLIFSPVVFFMGMSINVMALLTKVIPDYGYFNILLSSAQDYSSDVESSSIRYLLISFSTYFVSLYIYMTNSRNTKNFINITLLYFVMSSLNMYNITAYVRFINFIHPIFILLLVSIYKNFISNGSRNNARIIYNCIICFNLFMTYRLTDGRTSVNGYASSYMNNSIYDIFFSSLYTYLHTGFFFH